MTDHISAAHSPPAAPPARLSRNPLHLAVYPMLFAAAAVLALYADNVREVPVEDLVRPLALACGAALAALLISWPIAGKLIKAGPLALIGAGFLFAFGPVVHLLPNVRMRYLLPIWLLAWLALYILAALRLRRTRRRLRVLTAFLNLIAIGVLASPLIACLRAWSSPVNPTSPAANGRPAASLPASLPAERPDIYYIILDAYARQDILAGRFGMDNAPFVQELRRRGFFVADRAHANYIHTHLSLSSTLNMEYLDHHLEELGPVEDSKDGWQHAASYFYQLVTDSEVRRRLEGLGYSTMGLGSAYNVTRGFNDNAGVLAAGITEFEMVLLQQTVLSPLLERLRGAELTPHGMHRERLKYIFRRIPFLARQPGPKLVMLHLVCPHRPFVFRADGSDQPRNDHFEDVRWWPQAQDMPGFREWYRQHYPQQVQGLNPMILRAVDAILANSRRPPVIILQADHGSSSGLHEDVSRCDLQERFSILSAIRLSDGRSEGIPNDLSSVNTFRLLLSRLFGMDLPLLRNHAYHSGQSTAMTDVTDTVRATPTTTQR